MNLSKALRIPPETRVRLKMIDPGTTLPFANREEADRPFEQALRRIKQLQAHLYAENQQSLLIVLQGMDAAGKDGTIRKVFSGVNPQGVDVVAFKQPTPLELAHDFLWRIHPHVPAKGQIMIFNRSHYEDVLAVRVHNFVKKSVWSKRYAQINAFEELVASSGTRILKFFLHISAEEQLARFANRLNDKTRNWKISDNDYKERKLWPAYTAAFEDMLSLTSTERAPWFAIPANNKWYRNVAIATIIADTLEDMKTQLPKPKVDLDVIRQDYHQAQALEAKSRAAASAPLLKAPLLDGSAAEEDGSPAT